MRISDWSSDVCSSDLKGAFGRRDRLFELRLVGAGTGREDLSGGGFDDVEGGRAVDQAAIDEKLVSHDILSLLVSERGDDAAGDRALLQRSEEHTSELQSLMRISYAVFCLTKQTHKKTHTTKTR